MYRLSHNALSPLERRLCHEQVKSGEVKLDDNDAANKPRNAINFHVLILIQVLRESTFCPKKNFCTALAMPGPYNIATSMDLLPGCVCTE